MKRCRREVDTINAGSLQYGRRIAVRTVTKEELQNRSPGIFALLAPDSLPELANGQLQDNTPYLFPVEPLLGDEPAHLFASAIATESRSDAVSIETNGERWLPQCCHSGQFGARLAAIDAKDQAGLQPP